APHSRPPGADGMRSSRSRTLSLRGESVSGRVCGLGAVFAGLVLSAPVSARVVPTGPVARRWSVPAGSLDVGLASGSGPEAFSFELASGAATQLSGVASLLGVPATHMAPVRLAPRAGRVVGGLI